MSKKTKIHASVPLQKLMGVDCRSYLPSSTLVDAPVVERPLPNLSAYILDDVVVPVAAIAPTIDRLLFGFGLLELVDERIDSLDG